MRAPLDYRLLALLITAFSSYSAIAADEKGLYQTLNYISCPQYSEDRKLPLHNGRNAADELYISGWLSGYNYLTPNTYDIVPGHDVMKVMEWLDSFCQVNTSKSVESGLLQFTSDNYPTRMQVYPPQPAPAKSKKK